MAGVWAGIVNRAKIVVEEHAALRRALQDAPFRSDFCVVLEKCRELDAQEAGEALGIAIIDLCGCNPAAVRALCAIDGIFHLLRNGLKPPLNKIVPFQPGTKTLILLALLLAEALNLDEVGYHNSSIAV